MKAFLIEGYNKGDYISRFPNWEPLIYTETLQESFLYMDKMKLLNYETRVRLTDTPSNPSNNEHWDIIT